MLACWIEWKKACALDLCSARSQAVLQEFAGRRFTTFFQRCAASGAGAAHRGLSASASGSDRDAWHLFETHLVLKSTQGGKRYKDWLFAQARMGHAGAFDAIQGGATLIMRDVVREYLRREYRPRAHVSLQTPVASAEEGGSPMSLQDLLPGSVDPAREAALREYEALAAEHAADVFEGLSRHERVAVLARTLGISFAHPTVAQAAGRGRTVLGGAYQSVLRGIQTALRERYMGDDPESIRHLRLMTVLALKNLACAWGKSEGGCPEFFEGIGGGVRAELAGRFAGRFALETA